MKRFTRRRIRGTLCTSRTRLWSFTLLELLVVISIITVLAALVVPGVSAAKARAHAAGCINNLHQLGIAFQMYANDFGDKVPRYSQAITDPFAGSLSDADGLWTYHMTWRKYLPGIGTNYWQFPLKNSVYICPADPQNLWGTDYPTYQEWGGSYLYNVELGINTFPLADGQIPNSGQAHKILLIDAATKQNITYPKGFGTSDYNTVMVYNGEIPNERRHFGKSNALFFDWHVEAIDPATVTLDQVQVQ